MTESNSTHIHRHPLPLDLVFIYSICRMFENMKITNVTYPRAIIQTHDMYVWIYSNILEVKVIILFNMILVFVTMITWLFWNDKMILDTSHWWLRVEMYLNSSETRAKSGRNTISYVIINLSADFSMYNNYRIFYMIRHDSLIISKSSSISSILKVGFHLFILGNVLSFTKWSIRYILSQSAFHNDIFII